MADLDSYLTIVLPIKDRCSYTIRWLAYADRLSFPFKVLVADGGKDKALALKLKQASNFPKVDYEYIQFPYDQTYSHFYAKMVNVLSKVSTQFVVIIDDACIPVIDGYRHCVEFLVAHPDYSGCSGNIGCFSVLPDDKDKELNPAFGDEIQFYSDLYPFREVVDDTAAARVARHFAAYSPTWYDVHRTDYLSSSFNILKHADIKDIFLAELLLSCLTVSMGKVGKIADLYMMRQIKDRGSCAEDHRITSGDCFDRMLLETWSVDFSIFLNTISSSISTIDGTPLNDAQLLVKRNYRSYVAPKMINSLENNNVQITEGGVINALKIFIRKLKHDSLIRQFIYRIYTELPGSKRKQDLTKPIFRSSSFYKELETARKFLTSKISQ